VFVESVPSTVTRDVIVAVPRTPPWLVFRNCSTHGASTANVEAIDIRIVESVGVRPVSLLP
jgi:hypothetical protein